MKPIKKKYSKAYGWVTIILSILLVSGTAWTAWGFYYYQLRSKEFNRAYDLVAIVQTTGDEAIKTNYLAELLELSTNSPVNLYRFDIQKGQEHLNRFPLIKKATLHKIPPGTLLVDYELRKPVAYLGDVTNTAIDEEGVLFPFRPFLSPKKIPFIFLGGAVDAYSWGKKIEDQSVKLVMTLLKKLRENNLGNVDLIDVSRAFSLSLGERQIVIALKTASVNDEQQTLVKEKILILNPKDWNEGLERFLLLEKNRDKISSKGKEIIDLRLHKLAYILGG